MKGRERQRGKTDIKCTMVRICPAAFILAEKFHQSPEVGQGLSSEPCFLHALIFKCNKKHGKKGKKLS